MQKNKVQLGIVFENNSKQSEQLVKKLGISLKKLQYASIFLYAGGDGEPIQNQLAGISSELILFVSKHCLDISPGTIEMMVSELINQDADLVVAESKNGKKNVSRAPNILSKVLFRQKHLHSEAFLVRREIMEKVAFRKVGAEFLLKAANAGFKIAIVKPPGLVINKFGLSRLFSFGKLLLNLKRQTAEVALFGGKLAKENGLGFFFRSRKYNLYAGPSHSKSAFTRLSFGQTVAFGAAAVSVLTALLLDWKNTLIVVIAALTTIYFIDLLFNLFLIYRSFKIDPEIKVTPQDLAGKIDWPTYTVFCPLYKEWQVLPQFIKAVSEIDYPKDKLQVLLLLEENDSQTIEVVKHQKLPDFIQVVIVPDSLPKTKPKACNYGLRFAKGEYSVIFDAEDVPEPDQLKKAVLAFEKGDRDTVCMQAKLNFYNPKQNLLTKIFTAEYSLWFDLVLPGLQSIHAPLPLGGTSNHFRTSDLRDLRGWDAFNVTEDCDLGMRLAKQGYKTAIFNSTTWEEANSRTRNWFRQRSRWIKGYIQTYLVHIRDWPIRQKHGFRNLVFFQLTVGGKITSIFINPVMWCVTLLYFAFRTQLGPTIEQFFPGPILYMGVFSFVFGNFLYLYYYMIGCARRGFDNLIKYALLVPLYWIGMSLAAWVAFYEMAIRPHYWAKTTHGFHLPQQKTSGVRLSAGPVGAPASIKSRGWKLKGGALLFFAFLVSGLINLSFSVYMGRVLSLENFGVLNLFNSLSVFFAVFTSALTVTVNHKIAYLVGEKGRTGANIFFQYLMGKGKLIGVFLFIAWVLAIPVISDFFKLTNYGLGIIFSFVPLLGVIAAVYRGYFQGVSSFRLLALTVVAEPLIKTAVAFVLIALNLANWVMIALPVSLAASLFLLWVFIKKFQVVSLVETNALPKIVNFPKKFFAAALLTGLSSTLFLNADVILAKHYLGPEEAGLYALLSLTGKLIFYAGSLFTVFIMTEVSQKNGEGNKTEGIFAKLLLGTVAVAVAGWVGLSVFGEEILAMVFSSKIDAITGQLPYYSAGIALFTIANAFVVYHMAKEKLYFSVAAIAAGASLAAGISARHNGIGALVEAVFLSGIIYGVLIGILHLLSVFSEVLKRNIRDFLLLFAPIDSLPPREKEGGQKILIFNWRDTEHDFAGGAEAYIHELSKRWVALGHRVVVFCGNDGKSMPNESIDGVLILRRGGFYFVYFWAFIYYLFRFRGRFDSIIDSQNGVPFFTPLYVKEPVVCLMHHVHQKVFLKYLKPPLSNFATFLEEKAMPVVYRNVKFLTVSESSRKDMIRLGLGQAGIEVVNPGVNLQFLNSFERKPEPDPLVVFLGRLKPYKSVDVLIKAFKIVVRRIPNAKLVIIGSGEEDERLRKLTYELKLADKIKFVGKVSDDEKVGWLKRSWVAVNPSMMEGWGITTIEANACGVPVVASKVPGLIDSVKNPHTGYLFSYGDETELSKKVIRILESEKLRIKMGQEAIKWAQNFDWEDVALKALIAFLNGTLIKYPRKLRTIYEKTGFNPAG